MEDIIQNTEEKMMLSWIHLMEAVLLALLQKNKNENISGSKLKNNILKLQKQG